MAWPSAGGHDPLPHPQQSKLHRPPRLQPRFPRQSPPQGSSQRQPLCQASKNTTAPHTTRPRQTSAVAIHTSQQRAPGGATATTTWRVAAHIAHPAAPASEVARSLFFRATPNEAPESRRKRKPYVRDTKADTTSRTAATARSHVTRRGSERPMVATQGRCTPKGDPINGRDAQVSGTPKRSQLRRRGNGGAVRQASVPGQRRGCNRGSVVD